MKPVRVLIIAGSDSGGGAGIQADIKTVTMLGGHAMTAITAVTAQNSVAVTDVAVMTPDMVLAQIEAVASDIGVDAVKIGMLGSVAIADAVADWLEAKARALPIVFDPVMVATSGAALADAETIRRFERLMDIATLVTPNLPELQLLSPDGAAALARRHNVAVLAKGGHEEGAEVTDTLAYPDGRVSIWRDARIETRHSHGTGCTLASGIATGLAQGLDLEAAITRAHLYVRQALLHAPGFGAGHGPMGHGLGKAFDA